MKAGNNDLLEEGEMSCGGKLLAVRLLEERRGVFEDDGRFVEFVVLDVLENLEGWCRICGEEGLQS